MYKRQVEIDALDCQLVNDEFIITSSVENFWKTKNFLEKKEIIDFVFCEISFQPIDFINIQDENIIKRFWDLINLLEEDDDIQNIYYNIQ